MVGESKDAVAVRDRLAAALTRHAPGMVWRAGRTSGPGEILLIGGPAPGRARIALRLDDTDATLTVSEHDGDEKRLKGLLAALVEPLWEQGVRFIALGATVVGTVGSTHGTFHVLHEPAQAWAVIWPRRNRRRWRHDAELVGHASADVAYRLLAGLDHAELGGHTVRLHCAPLGVDALRVEALIVAGNEPVACATCNLGGNGRSLRIELERLVVRRDRRGNRVAREVSAALLARLRDAQVAFIALAHDAGGPLAAELGLGFMDARVAAEILQAALDRGQLDCDAPETAALRRAVEKGEVTEPSDFLQFGDAGRAALGATTWQAASRW